MRFSLSLAGRRRAVALAGTVALVAGGLVAAPATPAHAQTACEVTYQVAWDSGGGFGADVTIHNQGPAINGWTLEFDFPGNQQVGNGWIAIWSQTGNTVTAVNETWSATIPSGGSLLIGFNGTHNGTNPNPDQFTLNGTTCNGGGDPGPGPGDPPAVSLTSPVSGQQFTQGAPVTLAADADAEEGIERVDFFVDGDFVGTDGTAPYSTTADSLSLGGHSATAVAFDNGDPQQSTESAAVSFSVVEAAEPVLLADPGSVSVVEGNSATVTFSLSEPTDPVTVNLSTTSNVSAQPSSFQLDGTGGQQVSVTGLSPGSGSVVATASGFDAVMVNVNVLEETDPGERVANPYAGAEAYVNPDWAESVLDEAAATGGALGQQMAQVAQYPTAVWMDRRGAITDGRGLVGHLDAALAQQQAGGQQVVFQVVVYNLPNRDCAALASNGELRISEGGFEIYQEEYIDVIAEILSRPEYSSLRIATIIEVDSLPNLITNLNEPDCQEANGPGGYRDGIRYALNQLSQISNVYNYLDIAHSGWLGWPSNFGPAVNLYVDTLTSPNLAGPAPGLDSVNGFITNSANYTSTVEPFLPDPTLVLPGGGNQIMSADFYEFNPYFDELSFAQDLHAQFSSRGMSEFGMLIDTGRNGWGGPDRPTEVSSSTDVNTYVNESRIDQRPHRGGWCNQADAGIGERPTANPAANIHAYVWVKPPGESDGVADPDAPPDPVDEAKQHDPMCDPEQSNTFNPAHPTNALPGAPHAGRWFPEQFAMLVENAWPPIS